MRRTVCATVLLISMMLSSAVLFAAESAGDDLMAKNRYKDAAREYKAAIKDNGEKEPLLVKLASAYDAAKWYGQSVQIWERYLELFPNGQRAGEAKKKAARAHRWLGINFYNLGEGMDQVVHQLEVAIALDSKLDEAYYWLGRIYIQEGKFKEAVEVLSKLVSLNTASKDAQWLLKEARGMQQNGNKAYVSYRQGYDFYSKGKIDKAVASYKDAVNTKPDFADAYYWLARIEFERKNYKASSGYWEKVVSLQPDNKRAAWFLHITKSKAGGR